MAPSLDDEVKSDSPSVKDSLAIGARVSRYFENLQEWYNGEITEARVHEDGATLYHIYYKADDSKSFPDSDEEDLDEAEAIQAIKHYRQRTTMLNSLLKSRKQPSTPLRSPLRQRNTAESPSKKETAKPKRSRDNRSFRQLLC